MKRFFKQRRKNEKFGGKNFTPPGQAVLAALPYHAASPAGNFYLQLRPR
jgi:hypothetical protein